MLGVCAHILWRTARAGHKATQWPRAPCSLQLHWAGGSFIEHVEQKFKIGDMPSLPGQRKRQYCSHNANLTLLWTQNLLFFSGTENPAFPQFSTCTSSSTGEWTFSVLSILWFCLCCDVVCLHLDMHVHVNNFWCYGKQVWFRWYTIQIWDNIYLWCERAHLYLLYLYREPVRVRLKLQQRLHQKRISRSWRPDIWTLR